MNDPGAGEVLEGAENGAVSGERSDGADSGADLPPPKIWVNDPGAGAALGGSENGGLGADGVASGVVDPRGDPLNSWVNDPVAARGAGSGEGRGGGDASRAISLLPKTLVNSPALCLEGAEVRKSGVTGGVLGEAGWSKGLRKKLVNSPAPPFDPAEDSRWKIPVVDAGGT